MADIGTFSGNFHMFVLGYQSSDRRTKYSESDAGNEKFLQPFFRHVDDVSGTFEPKRVSGMSVFRRRPCERLAP
jgi:hypothetical protein